MPASLWSSTESGRCACDSWSIHLEQKKGYLMRVRVQLPAKMVLADRPVR